MIRTGRKARWVAWMQATVQLCLCIAPRAAQPGFLSIDCGSSSSYQDSVTGIYWESDEAYISTGVNSKQLTSKESMPDNATQLWDLRYFPDNRKRHCYILPVDANTTYLVRSMFLYAYFGMVFDTLSFDLTVNSTLWTTVTYGGAPGAPSLDTTKTYEIVFRSKGTLVSICLVKNQGAPFISSLELRRLEDSMYNVVQADKILWLYNRFNFGGNESSDGFTETVRYPDDRYDRIWVNFGTSTNSDTCPFDLRNSTPVMATEVGNRAPVKVMEDACIAYNNKSIFLSLSFPTTVQEYYAALYLQEIDRNALTSNPRGVILDVNNDRIHSEKNVTSAVSELFTPSSNLSDYHFTLRVSKAPWSTLGPIVNAAEFYGEGAVNTSETDSVDVSALDALRVSWNLTSWTGDPCFPVSWDWLTCNYSTTSSRVTQVMLTGMGIAGFIPPDIIGLSRLTDLWLDDNHLTGSIPDLSDLTKLQTLRLQNNSLTGAFPGYLFQLQNLTELYVESNNLTGSVPSCPKYSILTFRCDENPQLGCPSGSRNCNASTSRSMSGIVLIVVGAFLGGLAVLAIFTTLVFCYWKWKRKRSITLKESTPVLLTKKSKFLNLSGEQKDRAPGFSLKEVIKATENFATKIGEGSFGAVYYGKLPSGQEVAVKMNTGTSRQGTAEFVNEVNLLSRVHHKNLVSLLGYCEESEEQILIYAYMSNGTLRQHLYGDAKLKRRLDWVTRLYVAISSAKGLDYLHSGCTPLIIHRDVKSSNILLDDNLVAKVADFGLSKSGPELGFTSGFCTGVKGTPGYFDPEYFISQRLTQKSDVYSFGIVLLEIVSGRPPYHSELPDGTLGTLIEWMHLALRTDIFTIVDPQLENKYNPESMQRVIELAAACLEQRGINRPDMCHVVQMLLYARDLESPHFHNNTSSPSGSGPQTFTASSASLASSSSSSNAYMSSDFSYRQGR